MLIVIAYDYFIRADMRAYCQAIVNDRHLFTAHLTWQFLHSIVRTTLFPVSKVCIGFLSVMLHDGVLNYHAWQNVHLILMRSWLSWKLSCSDTDNTLCCTCMSPEFS